MHKIFTVYIYPVAVTFEKSYKLFSKLTGKASDSYTKLFSYIVIFRYLLLFKNDHFSVLSGVSSSFMILAVFYVTHRHYQFCDDLNRTEAYILTRFRFFITGFVWVLLGMYEMILYLFATRYIDTFGSFLFAVWSFSLMVFVPSYGKFDYSKVTDKIKDLTRSRTPAYSMG